MTDKYTGDIAVSIVVPMYNVAKYIGKCISCLQAQTLTNIEMIFVDDCGSDDSAEIVKRHAAEDGRIKLVPNERNLGAGASRNHGISVATGEYVAFFDPDDRVNPDFYERLFSRAKEEDSDVSIGDRIDVVQRANGELRYSDPAKGNDVLSACASGLSLYAGFIHGHQAAIYRLSVVRANGACYSDTSFGECGLFILKACCRTRRFCFVDGAYYYYLQHEDSQSHRLGKEKYDGELKAVFEQIDYAVNNLDPDASCLEYVARKFGFLLWRMRELVAHEPEPGYRRAYFNSIREKMLALPETFDLRLRDRRFADVTAGRYRRLVFKLKHARQIDFAMRVRGFVARRVKRLIRFRSPASRFDFSHREICYVQSSRGALFFCREFLERGGVFAQNFLSYFQGGTLRYNNDLPVGSPVYEEHRRLIDKGELCWKYVRRLGWISKSTIYLNDNAELCMRGEILGSNGSVVLKNHILLPQPERRIIDGVTLKDYISTKGLAVEEVVGELIQFLDYVFGKYEVKPQGPIKGIAFDARPCNCILKSGHEYELFDFEYEYRRPLERDFFAYLSTLDVVPKIRRQVYYRLCEHFHMIPNSEKWDKFILQGWIEIIAPTKPSKYLLEK